MKHLNFTFYCLISAVPIIIFFVFSSFQYVNIYYMSVFSFSTICLIIYRNSSHLLAYFLTQSFLISLLRGGFFTYNFPTVLGVFFIAIVFLKNIKLGDKIFFQQKYFTFFLFLSIYYLFCVVLTGKYNSNLKFIESGLFCALPGMLFFDRKIFKKALFFSLIIGTAFSIIISIKYGARVLENVYEFTSIFEGSNPITFGTFAGLFFAILVIAPGEILSSKILKINFIITPFDYISIWYHC